MNSAGLSITDLAAESGVARRTIHFYVREGLLAPPAKPGGGARYGTEHLVRLLRIRELQKHHYKLSAIRERLDDELRGMNPEDMEALLQRLRSATVPNQTCATAADLQQYLEKQFPCACAVSSKKAQADIGNQGRHPTASQAPENFSFAALTRVDDDSLTHPSSLPTQAAALSVMSPPTAPLDGHIWRRFTVRDGLEVQVRDDTLQRHRAEILQWLARCPACIQSR